MARGWHPARWRCAEQKSPRISFMLHAPSGGACASARRCDFPSSSPISRRPTHAASSLQVEVASLAESTYSAAQERPVSRPGCSLIVSGVLVKSRCGAGLLAGGRAACVARGSRRRRVRFFLRGPRLDREVHHEISSRTSWLCRRRSCGGRPGAGRRPVDRLGRHRQRPAGSSRHARPVREENRQQGHHRPDAVLDHRPVRPVQALARRPATATSTSTRPTSSGRRSSPTSSST